MLNRTKNKIYLVIGIILILIGLFLLAKSFAIITGSVILENISQEENVTISAITFIFGGIFSLFLSTKRRAKGQAAIEFLMTYGWAILASIIVIGVLAYFGIFSPGSYVGNSAFLSPPFYLNAWGVSGSGVELEIRNSGPEDMVIQEVTVDFEEGSCTYSSPEVSLQSGLTTKITISCSLTEGKNFNGAISVKYRKASSQLPQTTVGSIRDKVHSSSQAPSTAYSLIINIVGSGTVSCNGEACETEYSENTAVNIVPTPDEGSEFLGWSGPSPCEGPIEQECLLTMNDDKEVTASFT